MHRRRQFQIIRRSEFPSNIHSFANQTLGLREFVLSLQQCPQIQQRFGDVGVFFRQELATKIQRTFELRPRFVS